jgi:hypothetical protein
LLLLVCIFDKSAGRRIERRSAVTLCREAPAAFEQEQQRWWQLEGLEEEEERK